MGTLELNTSITKVRYYLKRKLQLEKQNWCAQTEDLHIWIDAWDVKQNRQGIDMNLKHFADIACAENLVYYCKLVRVVGRKEWSKNAIFRAPSPKKFTRGAWWGSPHDDRYIFLLFRRRRNERINIYSCVFEFYFTRRRWGWNEAYVAYL